MAKGNQESVPYGITTGYYDVDGAEAFFKLWMANTLKYAKPAEIIVANADGTCADYLGGTWANFKHNYGHAKRMEKSEKYCGWWLGFMFGAMTCFNNRHDFVYKEQDCLAFGSWIKHLYVVSERRRAPVVIGQFTQHPYRVEQSLVLIRRRFIMDFIVRYMAIPQTDRVLRPEKKFLALMEKYPKMIIFMDMGCGRDRPIPYDAGHFYAQHIKANELAELRTRGLI